MKKLLRFFGYFFLGLLGIILIGVIVLYVNASLKSSRNLALVGEGAPNLTEGNHSYRDLNKNGKLDVYEDSRQAVEDRVEDLLSQMTLDEKAGTMFISIIAMSTDGEILDIPTPTNPFSLMAPPNSELIAKRLMNHFNIFAGPNAKEIASWSNSLQKLAEKTRLGIPITIGSDPRHSFSQNIGANLKDASFSLWCEPLGLAATRDSVLVAEFGEIARQEYLATGIRLALHPMADLATEPRWARINGTFGEDAELSAQMTAAYILGFQGGDTLTSNSVACMTKHFSGGGPQKEGLDAHFYYGADQAYPGKNFEYHLIPFEAAFRVNTAQIMPYYGIPVGQTSEDVGFAFNKEIITGMLRNTYGFEGVICSDWGVLSDKKVLGMKMMRSTGWGVEHLSPSEKALKALDAGIDQFGGEEIPEVLVQLVKEEKLPESRLDESVRRLLRDKFTLGLFDDPYLEVEKSVALVGNDRFMEAGKNSQRKSMVLLKNEAQDGKPILPVSSGLNIYVENMEEELLAQYGQVVETPEEADIAILRLATPWVPRSGGESMLENFFHQGDLDFKGEEKARILEILEKVPTIVDVYMDRPAVIPDIAKKSKALITNFGAQDEILLELVFGEFNPSGKLPFEIPSSMEAVENQFEDMPYDSKNPLYPFGAGMRFENKLELSVPDQKL